MPVSTATLPQLVHQIREKFEGANVARCCILIGAGCSYNSKIPLGSGIVELLRMEAFRQQHIFESTNWPLENASEYQKQFEAYLDAKSIRQDFDTFCTTGQEELQQQIDNLSADIKKSKLPLEVQKVVPEQQNAYFEEKKAEFYQDAQYEYWFNRYSENASDRQRFVERVIDGKDTGYGYVTLASLMAEGYVRNVFTTNFDDLLHDALMLFFNERAKVYAHSDLSDFLNLRDKKPNIIKLHGDFRYQDIRNTTFEIDETRNRLSEKLCDALSETPCFNLVVIGYGGADVSILNQLQKAKLQNPLSPFRLIWTDRKPLDQLHWRVRHLLETTRNNFFLQIESFDLLMLQLHQALQLRPVNIEEKAKERQREIDSYYGQMRTEVANANLSSEDKESLQDFLQANKLFNQALESEDLNEQCLLYEQALQFRPDYPDALYNWGVTLDQLSRFGESISKYEQVLQLKPDYFNALINWGIALGKLDRFEEAIGKFKQAFHLKPDRPDVFINWGAALYKRGRLEEAIDKYQQALQLKLNDLPTAAKVIENWGVALDELGRFDEAISKFKQALQLKPNYPDAFNHWGVTLGKLEQFDEAIGKFRQALRLKPDYPDPFVNWGTALYHLGRFEETIDKYEQALQLKSNDPKLFCNWGIALNNLGRFEESIVKYEQALHIKPSYPDAINNWGITLSKLGRFEEAIDKYEQVLRLESTYTDAHFNMACAYGMMTNISETIRCLNKWREVDKTASVEKINSDSDLDRIRKDPVFQRYLQSWK
ncbi:tetratricopeptide repeat protein [Spirosoma gilvum]